ncbi:hypothetical protein [Methylobacterium sp. SI9]|uniref:hypothetical protein n=1 Tax=Methylobacterium guangdongense TaxID=3138811 RepID=UPI00313C18AE
MFHLTLDFLPRIFVITIANFMVQSNSSDGAEAVCALGLTIAISITGIARPTWFLQW